MKARVIAGVLIALGAALYAGRLDTAAGLYVDDAWYVVLAKAIAQGDGYRLISSAAQPIVPTFPPGFPLLLAPLVALFPDFPANVFILKSVSIVAMFGVAAMSFAYLHRYRGAPPAVAATVAAVTLLMPAFVFLATSTIMAEATFTLCQIGLALCVERSLASPGPSNRTVIVSGIVAGITLLVRMAGIAAVAAAALCFFRARPRAAALFVAVVAAFYIPWAGYSAASGQTIDDLREHGGSVSYRYQELLAFRFGGQPSSGTASLSDLPARITDNIVSIFGRDIGAQLFPSAYRGADESGQEVFVVSGLRGFQATSMGSGAHIVLISSLLSVVMVIGFVSTCRRGLKVSEWMVMATIGMVVLLPPLPTYRYVLPLAPFVVFYFFAGVSAIAAGFRRDQSWQFGRAFRVTAMCVLLMYVLDHAGYLLALRSGRATWRASEEEVRAVTDWMNGNLPDGAVATSNPGLVWLLTGRKTIALMNPATHWTQWQESGIRYAAALTVAPRPSTSLRYSVLFESPRYKLWVISIPPRLTESDKAH